MQTTFWEGQDSFLFFIFNFRILLLRFGLQINATNYFTYQRRPTFRLPSVMFRGTPCTFSKLIRHDDFN